MHIIIYLLQPSLTRYESWYGIAYIWIFNFIYDVGCYLFRNKFSALNCFERIVYNTLMVNKFGKHSIERVFCLNQLTIYSLAPMFLLRNLHLVERRGEL